MIDKKTVAFPRQLYFLDWSCRHKALNLMVKIFHSGVSSAMIDKEDRITFRTPKMTPQKIDPNLLLKANLTIALFWKCEVLVMFKLCKNKNVPNPVILQKS
jgi:hypothetical protein